MFIPTDKCPNDVKKAMDEFNSYTFPEEYKKSKMKKHDWYRAFLVQEIEDKNEY